MFWWIWGVWYQIQEKWQSRDHFTLTKMSTTSWHDDDPWSNLWSELYRFESRPLCQLHFASCSFCLSCLACSDYQFYAASSKRTLIHITHTLLPNWGPLNSLSLAPLQATDITHSTNLFYDFVLPVIAKIKARGTILIFYKKNMKSRLKKWDVCLFNNWSNNHDGQNENGGKDKNKNTSGLVETISIIDIWWGALWGKELDE